MDNVHWTSNKSIKLQRKQINRNLYVPARKPFSYGSRNWVNVTSNLLEYQVRLFEALVRHNQNGWSHSWCNQSLTDGVVIACILAAGAQWIAIAHVPESLPGSLEVSYKLEIHKQATHEQNTLI